MYMRVTYDIEKSRPSWLSGAALELSDGTDAELSWDGAVEIPPSGDPGKRRAGVFLTNVSIQCTGTTGFRKCSPEDLSGARLLDLSFREAGAMEGVEAGYGGHMSGTMIPLDTYSDKFPSTISWKDIDRGARSMVRYFNNRDLPTEASCSGHPGTSMKRFWIDFRADVTDHDIARFMDGHTRDGNHAFAANGMFCARYGLTKGAGVSKTLQYTAPDLLAAAMDLADWVTDDMSGQPGHGGMDRVPWNRDRDAARIVTANMDPGTADALYRAVWKDRVLEDIRSRVDDLDEQPLAPEQEDYAAELYVYEGKYDCNLCYWDNIDNVIQLAREFA